ncbi:MAG: hypothetical protein K2X59_06125 [Sphingomonas sp.]|nr:hypothetical protein [Sphingomonas sp.]
MEALAPIGGANDNLADRAAVFESRDEKNPDGTGHPAVYHINILKPCTYFRAQKFIPQKKDVIYLAGARATEPIKLL